MWRRQLSLYDKKSFLKDENMDFDVNKPKEKTLLLIFFNKKLSELLKVQYKHVQSVPGAKLSLSFAKQPYIEFHSNTCPNPISVSSRQTFLVLKQ